MKYLKEYLDDYATWKEGDEVYCINDKDWDNGLVDELTLGNKYKIQSAAYLNPNYEIWTVNIDNAVFRANRFTKNTQHPVLLQKRFDL